MCFSFFADETITKNGDICAKPTTNGVSNEEVSKVPLKLDGSPLDIKTTAKLSSIYIDKNVTPKTICRTEPKTKTTNGQAISKKEQEIKHTYQNGIASDESEDVNAEKGELEANENVGEKKDEQDVVFIQDVGFTIKIQSPGTEVFDVQVSLFFIPNGRRFYQINFNEFITQVSSMELVQEIHQMLMDREDTCHRTCFSLQLDGNTLDNFAELKNVEGLKEGSVIKVCFVPQFTLLLSIILSHW